MLMVGISIREEPKRDEEVAFAKDKIIINAKLSKIYFVLFSNLHLKQQFETQIIKTIFFNQFYQTLSLFKPSIFIQQLLKPPLF